MKLRLLAAATLAALALTAGTASAQDVTSEKGKVSYALGYRAGMQVADIQANGEQVDLAAVIKGLQDAAARKDPAVPGEQLGAAWQSMQNRIAAKIRADLERKAADNKAKGDAFLAQNRAKNGVKVLPSGVQYRVIEAGSGVRPTQENQITIEYTISLPDGTVIEDTNKAVNGVVPGPVTERLSGIPFPGLREALQQMPNGARWEVVLPGSAAVGTSIETARDMANQVLVCNVKLLSVGPVVPAPQRPAAPPR
jgi:FKBP-type peptidyl-prolyl cis-trans isomerase